jgi:hypothetical protein
LIVGELLLAIVIKTSKSALTIRLASLSASTQGHVLAGAVLELLCCTEPKVA